MRFLGRILGATLCAGVLATAPAAQASDSSNGYITDVLIFADGTVLFNHGGQRGAPPACGAGLNTRWAFKTADAAGQARLAALLSAAGMNKKVDIVGLGVCSVWGDTESLNYFVVKF